MTTGTRKIGDFCWMNMLTAQPTEACAFFGTLLGWTYADMPGLGFLVKVGGREMGGLFDVAAPNTPKGTKPHIGVMVKVENADANGKKVATLGGRAQPPFDVMENGRMGVCFDPTGAAFDVWQPLR